MKSFIFSLILFLGIFASNASPTTTVYDLMDVQADYGVVIPDLQPTAANYFHIHAVPTNFKFDNISRISGIEVSHSVLQNEFEWEFTFQNSTVSGYASPSLNLFDYSCNGGDTLYMKATHIESGAVYKNQYPAYVYWTEIEYPECFPPINTLVEFWPDYPSYAYVHTWPTSDRNHDGAVNLLDILDVLAHFSA